MNLKDTLKLAKQIAGQSSSNKGLVPVYESVFIRGGAVEFFNGMVSGHVVCPDIEGMPDVVVPIEGLTKAIAATGDDTREIVLQGEKLIITDTKARARISLPTIPADSFPTLQGVDGGEGAVKLPVNGEGFLNALHTITNFGSQFMQPNMKPFMASLCIIDGWVYASEFALGVRVKADAMFTEPVADFHMPVTFAHVLAASGKAPVHLVNAPNSVIAVYEGGTWLASLKHAHEIPTQMPTLFAAGFDGLPAVPDGLRDALAFASKFHTTVTFRGGKLTAFDPKKENDIAIEGFAGVPDSAYAVDILTRCLAQAATADFTKYPNAVPFAAGDAVQGVFMGSRV